MSNACMKMSTIFGSKALQLGTVGTQSSQSFGFCGASGHWEQRRQGTPAPWGEGLRPRREAVGLGGLDWWIWKNLRFQTRFCWLVWFEFLRFEFGCVDVFVCDERWLLHDGHVILILVYSLCSPTLVRSADRGALNPHTRMKWLRRVRLDHRRQRSLSKKAFAFIAALRGRGDLLGESEFTSVWAEWDRIRVCGG